MEKWQREHIRRNLSTLIEETEFNIVVTTELLANNILYKTDVESLGAESDRKGKTSASYKYYDILMTRTGAYKVLIKALEKTKQSGAAKILKNGMLEFLIPKNLELFKDMEISVQGTNRKIGDIFPIDKLQLARTIFEETILEVKFNNWFVEEQETFVLATSTLPPEPPFHIPRFISNRIEISESVFKEDCRDIFVFKNNIERWKLSEIAKPNWTAPSNDQLSQITARFIHLVDYEDWNDLKNIAKAPIHLINYDAKQQKYILEESSGALEILHRIGSQKQRTYLSEDEFIQQQLSEDLKSSSVCICDKPGMGKTYLLASIARFIFNQCNRAIVAFIQLSTFVADLTLSSHDPVKDHDTAILNVFKYVSPSHEHAELLRKLAKAKLLRMEIFFDGFDEIPSEKVEWMKQVFLWIKDDLPNVRIYLTSRPHMRHELEKSLGVIAYDILPFNVDNQVDFLVRFWSSKHPELDQTDLKVHALNCVKTINKKISKNDKKMAGIPLLCRLIAEVNSKKVRFYVTTKAKNVNFPVKIAAMYQKFIQERIKTITRNENEFMNIKLVHVFHALRLLFPGDGFHYDGIFDRVHQLDASSKVLKAGIMHLESSSKLEFIHRTFAEYFVAEHFSEKLLPTAQKPKAFNENEADESQKFSFSILKQLFSTSGGTLHRLKGREITFLNSVIVSFVDFNLNEIRISEETTSTIAVYCASLSPGNLLSILCLICRHNLLNLLNFLKEALRKWDRNQKNEYFTTENCHELLGWCIRESTSQMFHSCIQFIKEELRLDSEQKALYGEGRTLLHAAAFYGNYEAFEYLIDQVSLELSGVLQKCVERSCINDVDRVKRRENILMLLHYKRPALINDNSNILNTEGIHVNLFKTLVKLGASLTAIDSDGYNCLNNLLQHISPLHFHELVEFLLTDYKARYLFLPEKRWRDPLPSIIKNVELLETLDLLLNIPGININKKGEYGENLLFSAVSGNKLGNLAQLLNHGLDLNERNTENKSLLQIAAAYGDTKMVRHLLQLKLDVNSEDVNKSTPLHYGAYNEKHSVSVVEILVENGANVQAKNINGQSALHIVARKQYRRVCDVIEYLIEKGSGVNDRDNEGNTPLHLCKNKEVRDCLIKMGADIHATNKYGQTVLHTTASKWDASCDEIKYLIKNGVGVNDRDNDGNTPLHLYDEKEVRDCLIEMGADIHATNKNGQTVLHTTASRWNVSFDEIKYLITNGVGVSDRDNDGNSPLHLCDNKGVRDCLIEMGADIHATNKYGETPEQMNLDLESSDSETVTSDETDSE